METNNAEHRQFDVIRRPGEQPVKWEIIENDVRDDTLNILCVNEFGDPEILRVSISRARVAPHDAEFYSVVNLHAQRERDAASQQTEVVPPQGAGINLQFQLSPKGEEGLLEWLKTASSVQNSSSTPSSTETEVLNLSD